MADYPAQVTNVTATAVSQTRITVSWTNNSSDGPLGTDYRTYIWLQTDSGGWNYLTYRTGSQNAYDHTVTTGHKYEYKLSSVWRCSACAGYWYWADPAKAASHAGNGGNPTLTPANYTTAISRSIYADSQTGGIAVGGSYTDTQYSSGTFCTGGIAVSGTSSSVLTCSNTYTGGIAVGGIYTDSLVTPVDYAYYIGTDDGIIYRFGTDYLGDKGLPITSTWESKTVDFSDLDPALTGIKKTIYGITLFYEDKATSAPFTIYLSNDGGATWSSSTKTCGTTTNKVAEKTFFFVPTASSTGHYFKFRIEHASAAQEFKWLGLRVEFEPQGKYYALS